MLKPFLVSMVTTVALMGLVACGGDDDSEETPTPGDTATPGADATETPDPGATATATAIPLPDYVDPGETESDNSLTPEGLPQLVDVRIGSHETFDRIVFEFEGDELSPWEVKYVPEAIACGSGKVVQVGGTAALEVMMPTAQAHTPEGELTIPSIDIVADYPAIVQGVQSCDFEALVTWVVGTNGARPFRVFTLEEPVRLVVDVEHP